jgi:hypothetical protein
VLWLLLDATRRGVRLRTLLVLPLLVVWANIHGSVVVGALLTAIVAVGALVHARKSGAPRLPPILLLLAPLCVLASPYAVRLPAYYHLMLVDPPFAGLLREWEWSSPSGTTAFFWLLVGVAVGLLALRRCRSRLTWFEIVTLVVTLVPAIQAVRGVLWFALVAAATLPIALDGLLTRPDVAARRINRSIAAISLGALAVAAVAAVARPTSWYLSEWPEAQVAAVRSATRDSSSVVYPTDRHADWLLWRIPDLRGRLAYDIRFELYDRATVERIVRYVGRQGSDWKAIADQSDVIVIDAPRTPQHAEAFLAEPGAAVVYADGSMTVVRRQAVR